MYVCICVYLCVCVSMYAQLCIWRRIHIHMKITCYFYSFTLAPTMSPPLDQVGMTLLVDHSGRIKKRPTIKDLVVNRDVACSHMKIFHGWVWDLNRFFRRMSNSKIPWRGPQSKVVLCVVEGSLGRVRQTPQLSAYTLQKAILVHYQDQKMFPEGICAAQPAVEDWALQNGVILKRLVWDSVATTALATRTRC